MEAPKLFVILPMQGRSNNDILEDMHKIHKSIEIAYERKFDLIDTLLNESQPASKSYSSAWYLGESIQKIDSANLVALHPDWRSSDGCYIEFMTAHLYGIPYVELTKDYRLLLTTMDDIRKAILEDMDVAVWTKKFRNFM